MSKTPRVSIFRSFRSQFPDRHVFPPKATRLMRASNEYFSADAVWTRRDGIWSCTDPDPVISWMRGLDPASAKLELARMGCSWEWLSTVPAQIDRTAPPEMFRQGHDHGTKANIA